MWCFNHERMWGSQYMDIHKMSTCFKKFRCFIDLFVCNLIINIDLCQGENKNNLILDINDQIITYVFTSKGTQVVYLNFQ